jgi:type II secretory pathway component PulF
MLAVLTQHRVSLADSLRLAADAAAHSELREVVLSQMADRRQDTSVDRPARRRLPSFLQWLLDQGDQVPGFVDMLRLAATTYRERGDRRARRVRFAVPILACLFVAGGITLFYALLLFWPMVQTLRQLS